MSRTSPWTCSRCVKILDLAGGMDLDLHLDVNVTMGVDLMSVSSPMMCPSQSSCGPLIFPPCTSVRPHSRCTRHSPL